MFLDHLYLNLATGRFCKMGAVKCLWIKCEEFHEPPSTTPCLSNVSDVFGIVHLRRINPHRFEGRIYLRLQMEKEKVNLLW